MTSYTRTIRFQRVGLHTDVPDLHAKVTIAKGHGGSTYESRPSLADQIEDHVRPHLAHHGSLRVQVHPDLADGVVYGRDADRDGPLLAEFTVHLDDEGPSSE